MKGSLRPLRQHPDIAGGLLKTMRTSIYWLLSKNFCGENEEKI